MNADGTQRSVKRDRESILGRDSFGWVTVGASFLLLFGSFSTQLSFGFFLKPLTEEFGWSRAAVSGGISILMGTSGLMAMVMGRVTDRYGARAAVLPGVLIGALSCLLLSRITSLWQFYLLYGVGGGIIVGCTFTPSVTAVSRRFKAERRTTAIALVLLGPIIGQMILSLVVSQVIAASGWRTTWVVLAPITLACGLPAMVVLGRKRRSDPLTLAPAEGVSGPGNTDARKASEDRHGLSTKEAWKTGAFWNLLFAGAVTGMGFTAFAAHVVAYATDTGIPPSAAALTLTLGSAGGVAGSLLAGTLTARASFRSTLFGLTALNGVALLLFIPARGIWVFYLLSVMLGFAFNCANPVRMAVVPHLFGMRAVGSIVGLSVLSFCLGSIVGPFLAGYMFDSTADYALAFMIFGLLLMVGTLFLYFLRAPSEQTGNSPG